MGQKLSTIRLRDYKHEHCGALRYSRLLWNAIGPLLQSQYYEIMNKTYGYLNPEKMKIVKNQSQELRNLTQKEFQNMKRFTAFTTSTLLLTMTLTLLTVGGCNKDEEPVRFVEAIPANDSTIEEDETIVIVFDAQPRDLDVQVRGGKFSLSGTSVTITGPFAPGRLNVILTWTDGTTVLSYTVENPQPSQPEIAIDNFDDPFSGGALQNPNWQWRNEPDDWSIIDGNITDDDNYLFIDAENNRNLWISDNTHFLYQETSADTFDVETNFVAFWNTSSAVTGLVVKSPADNDWVTLKFWARDAQADDGQVQFQARGRALAADPAWRAGRGISGTQLFFRLRKDGNSYTGFYKRHKTNAWTKIATANVPLTPPLQLGIYAGVEAGTGTLEVSYHYFRSVQ